MVGYNLRFHPGLLRLRELLHAGAIGKPLSRAGRSGRVPARLAPVGGLSPRATALGATWAAAPVLTFSHELDSVCWLLGAPHAVTADGRARQLARDRHRGHRRDRAAASPTDALARCTSTSSRAPQRAACRDRRRRRRPALGVRDQSPPALRARRHASGASRKATGASSATTCTWPSCAISSTACGARSSDR